MDDFSISILDLLLVIVTGFFGFRSLFKGIVKSVFSFLGICAAYLTASLYYKPVALRLSGFLDSPPWVNIAGFSLLLLAVIIAFIIIEMAVLQMFNSPEPRRDLNRLLAFIVGLLEGFLFCSVILWVLQNDSLPNSKTFLQNSIFASYFLDYNPLLFGLEKRLDLGVFR
ncbi:CvpA family protein [Candidatus Haliotispira prima]|uniref:CvpA family protein n=1 Tax=Candidatus Haliotispira prima TaxID=3034016 RepID=A0ABY8MFC9_9SPIO|nr:CvpA family protein [Candidatus Haliotispira prima]